MARVIFVYHWLGKDGNGRDSHPIGCSNMRILSERSGVGYENLVRVFTRERRRYWSDGASYIVKIYESDILRGKQKLSKVGIGRRFGR